MNNRVIWVALGLVLAVAVTIVWALTRFHATAVEHKQAATQEKAAASLAPDAEGTAIPAESSAIEDTSADELPSGVTTAAGDTRTSALPRDISLHGVVSDARGIPLALRHRPNDQESEIARLLKDRVVRVGARGSRFEGKIDERGNYSITGLHEGMWSVLVYVDGYILWHSRVQLTEAEVDRQLDIALEPEGVFQVRIEIALDDVPEGASAAKAESFDELLNDCEGTEIPKVITTREQLQAKWEPEVVTDLGQISRNHAGREEHDGSSTWVIQQTIRVSDGLPVYASVVVGNQVLRSERAHVQGQDLNFSLTFAQIAASFGGVRFRVVDEGGRTPGAPPAIHGYRGPILNRVEFDLPCREDGAASSRTAASGEVQIDNLRPGPIGIELRQPGFARAHLEAIVHPGVVRDLGVIHLASERAIRGKVANPDGSPANAEVRCFALRSVDQGPSLFPVESCRTDSPGHFVFYHSAPGRYLLRAQGIEDSGATAVVSTEGGSVDGIVLRLQTTSEVEFSLERPLSSAVILCVNDSSGLPVWQAPMLVIGDIAHMRADLVNGKYTARATSRGDVLASAEFKVSNNALRVVLTPP